jgi:hypothetical protein
MDRLGHWRFRAWWTQLPCSMWPLRVVVRNTKRIALATALALPAATLPGASTTLNVLTATTPRWPTAATGRVARTVPALALADRDGLLSAIASFGDRGPARRSCRAPAAPSTCRANA